MQRDLAVDSGVRRRLFCINVSPSGDEMNDEMNDASQPRALAGCPRLKWNSVHQITGVCGMLDLKKVANTPITRLLGDRRAGVRNTGNCRGLSAPPTALSHPRCFPRSVCAHTLRRGILDRWRKCIGGGCLWRARVDTSCCTDETRERKRH